MGTRAIRLWAEYATLKMPPAQSTRAWGPRMRITPVERRSMKRDFASGHRPYGRNVGSLHGLAGTTYGRLPPHGNGGDAGS